jgi:GNAT superfamily N-acetyltransferase
MRLRVHPLTPDRAADAAALFAADSVTRGCWCLHWRLPKPAREAMAPDDRRAAFLALPSTEDPPGLIGYDDAGPAAWVQITPRERLPQFQRVPTARPAADTPPGTWALSCFFLRKDLRRQGLMTELARAACAHAAARGATAVEAAARRREGSFLWGEGFTGLVPSLAAAGFAEVETRTPLRVLMRWVPPVSAATA